MGCDIHGVFQKLDGYKWIDVPLDMDFRRHYHLFTILANVRSCGDVDPISLPRGLPIDFNIVDENHHVESIEFMEPWRREYLEDEDGPLSVWMGDHSLSWLTGDELISWHDEHENDRDVDYFFNYVREQRAKHGQIRFVFGFDS